MYNHVHVLHCFRKDSVDSVEILRHFQKNVMIGRPLDLYSQANTIEGETNDICVSRFDIFDSIMEEFSTDNIKTMNLRLPLDVTFHGEQAEDFGGPRRHFFNISMQMFKERLFEEGPDGFYLTSNSTLLRKNCYFIAGIILGLCYIL